MEESMIRSRTAFVFLLVCGLVVLGSVSGQQTDASRPGWISDESCGTQHTKPGRADCVQKCWRGGASVGHPEWKPQRAVLDRKSTRLNSSHPSISYAVFCLKKKNT